MTSAEGYYIVAHVTNGVDLDRAEVVLAVASESISGAWFTTEGTEVWPFQKWPIEFTTPTIPPGWIEHLHHLAHKRAANQPTFSLIDALGIMKTIHKPLAPIKRRF